jgi:DnaJ-class molecular chaperone
MPEQADTIEFPDLERACSECRGDGHTFGRRCPVCDGVGYEPTEFGVKLLILIRHNIRRILKTLPDEPSFR